VTRILESCGATCNSCVKANDFCEIGLGGDVLNAPLSKASYDLIDQPFLTEVCEWQDTPAGLRQITNAWGNAPGENIMMGCMAILKGAEYTDFIMEVEAQHDDNDASGFIFGMDPANPDMYYQVQMLNDDWPGAATDFVPGPHLKVSKRNGLPCNGTMTPENDCENFIRFLKYSFLKVTFFYSHRLRPLSLQRAPRGPGHRGLPQRQALLHGPHPPPLPP